MAMTKRSILWVAGAMVLLLAGCGGATSEPNKAQTDVPKGEKGLYVQAQQAENDKRPADAIALYRQILDEYPDSPENYKAQFLIGFVFSEEMNEPDSARIAFQAVLDKYPESEFADDAKAMLAFIDGKMPEFQEAAP